MSVSTTFAAPRAAALANPITTAKVFLQALPSGSTTPAIAYIPGANRAAGRGIHVILAGTATGGTTTNLTIALLVGTSATVGSDSALATTGAIAINSASGNFMLRFDGVLDATSGTLIGTVSGYLNATAVTYAISSAVTSLDPSGASIGLVASALFSATNANNTVSLTQFDGWVD